MPISVTEWEQWRRRRQVLKKCILEFLRENRDKAFNVLEIARATEPYCKGLGTNKAVLTILVRDLLRELLDEKKAEAVRTVEGAQPIVYYRALYRRKT